MGTFIYTNILIHLYVFQVTQTKRQEETQCLNNTVDEESKERCPNNSERKSYAMCML